MMQHSALSQHARRILISVIVAAGVILFSACDLLLPQQPLPHTATATQTETPTPTIDWFPATPTPTLIPQASPTPYPTQEGQIEGLTEILVEDDFTDVSLWETQQSSAGNIAFGTQYLTLAVARPSTSLLSISQHTAPSNFALELTVQPSLCEPTDQIGIIFWHQSNTSYHRLLMNCGGQYRLELMQGGQSVVLHDWEQAAQMQLASPATNRFILWVYEGQFQLYINEVFQFEERISADLTGSVGLFARTLSGNTMTIRFSDLKIYSVELN